MLRGLTTVSLFADDVAAAAQWYSQVLGIEPYYQREVAGTPAYIEFRVGDYQHELGIIDRRFAGGAETGSGSGGGGGSSSSSGGGGGGGGTLVYWHVDDLAGSLERLLALGATPHRDPVEHGPGFVTASVIDPFGNVLGIMYNQHYLEVLGSRQSG